MTPRPLMARWAILSALLQPALASFYTVTSYYVVTTTTSQFDDLCTSNCEVYTDTAALITVNPTVTPTAKPISSTTFTNSYDDVQVVSIFLAPGAVPNSDLVTTTATRTSGVYTDYAVPITWTAPASCPTHFTVVTFAQVFIPEEATAHLTPQSTATEVLSITGSTSTTWTYLTLVLAPTAVPSSAIGNPTTYYAYSDFVASCINPTAGYSSSSGSGSGGYRNGGGDGDNGDNYTVCSALTGCVALATWIIVVASVLPALFLLGFLESYFWFRRLMLGKSALRLGTVCWCLLSLWCVCVTRRSPERTAEDQVLLRQYWATLSAGTRVKYWFKHGFRWRYPTELLGDPRGGNPAVVVPVQVGPGPVGGGEGPGPGSVADEKALAQGVYAQPVPVRGQTYVQPYPGAPGFPGAQGFAMPGAPQPANMMPQPGFVPGQGAGDAQWQQQQQQQGHQPVYPAYIPSPSPVQSTATGAPSMQPTPPPPHEQHHLPPGGPPQE